MSNPAQENAISISSPVYGPVRQSDIMYPGQHLRECPDSELGLKCQEVCLDEFITCINECGSETEDGFQNDARPPTPSNDLFVSAISIILKTISSVRVTAREKILIANMHVHVVTDVPMVV